MSNAAAAVPAGGGGGGGDDRRGAGINNRGGGGRGGGAGQGGGRGSGSNRNNNNNNRTNNNRRRYNHGVERMEQYQFGKPGGPEDSSKMIVAFHETLDQWVKVVRSSKVTGTNQIAKGLEAMDGNLMRVVIPPMPPATITVQDAAGADVVQDNTEAVEIWRARLRSVTAAEEAVAEARETFFGDTLALCSLDVESQLKKLANWIEIRDSTCPVRLLEEIKLIMYNAGRKFHPATMITDLVQRLYSMQQGNMTDEKWYDHRVAMIKAIDSMGGSVCHHTGLIQRCAEEMAEADGRDAADVDADDIAAATEDVEEECMGALILSGANAKHDDYKAKLHNDYRNGINNYPRGAPAALEDMSSHINTYTIGRDADRRRDQQRRRNEADGRPGNDEGLNFLQHHHSTDIEDELGETENDPNPYEELADEEVDVSMSDAPSLSYAEVVRSDTTAVPEDAEADDTATAIAPNTTPSGASFEHLINSGETCAHCGGDHALSTCPEVTDEDLQAMLERFEATSITTALGSDGGMLFQGRLKARGSKGGLKSNFLYLDTCTTENVMSRSEYLSGIHNLATPLVLHTNAGTCSANQQGYLGSTLFWLDRLGIANVISLRTLEKLYRVTYDSRMHQGSFICETPDGNITFRRCADTGFPYIDLDEHADNSAVLLVQTVRQNYEGFTRIEVEKAIAARRAQALTGHPSEPTMKREVSRTDSHSLFRDCPVSSKDITNANRIFGPSLPIVKGKTVRKRPSRVEPQFISIPAQVMELNKFITLVADVMFVNGLPFFVTLSRNNRFVTVQFVPRRTAGDLGNVLKQVIMLYKRAGFICQTAIMDGEFEKLRAKLSDSIVVNTTSKNEHVGEIENKIKDLKNVCRSIIASLPYKILPNAIIKGLVHHAIMMMNAFPAAKGVSKVFSPRELVLRWQLNFGTHCVVPFGSLCTVYDDADRTNIMTERSFEGINLGASGNMQGSHKFYCLSRRRVFKRRQFDERPMPDSTIRLLNSIGTREEQEGRLRFHNRNNEPFSWTDEDENEILIEDNAIEPPIAPFPAIPAEEPGITLQVEGEQPAMTPSPPIEVNSSINLPHVEAIFNAATGGVPHVAAARAHINVDVVPAEDNEIEPLDEASLPSHIDHSASDSSVESSAFAPEPEEPGDHDLNDNEFVDEAEEAAAEEADVEDAEVEPAIEEEGDDNLGVRRGTRIREPTRRYMNITVSDEAKETKVQVMNPRMFSNAAVNHVLGTQPPIPRSKLATTMPDDNILEPMEIVEEDLPIMGMIFAQFSLKKGIREFGEKAEQGAMKEMKQMHDMDAFIPRHFKSLTKEERTRALSTLIFLKQKSSGDIKGRTCVNGAPQREYIRKEDAASPTAATDSLFITGAIDAHERRHVACCDLPGAFLHCETDEHVIVVLRGELAELMVQVDPSIYRKYVSTDKKGKPILYMQLYKSVYGLMRSALLFYRKLRGELESYGFTVNPYDPCVANMMVPRSSTASAANDPSAKDPASDDLVQLTVLWHVDDLKISCANDVEITMLLLYLKNIYGDKISMNRGKVHEYLGMTLDFSEPGVFNVTMIPYIGTIISDFPEAITKSAPSPYTDNLFKVRDEADAKFLPEEQAVAFHRTVAQLLFLCYRARKDIQTAVSFLTTRVRRPDEDDWGKVKRVLRYLYGTRSLPLRLTVDDLTVAKWNIDASHAVHWDCKGQTGAGMTLGKGAVSSFSWKQKINTKSSTESEIVGVDDAMPSVLWSLYFIQAQGYDMTHALIQQDNKSAILMEVNGKMSSSKRTKHIRIKYFFVTDRVAQGDIVIEHKPTGEMWIDMNTKPKQGTPFRTDRSLMMNCPLNVPDETLGPICN